MTGAASGWALVTGGCSGIGRALAEGLARRGHPLLLVSNRPGPLAETAATLRAAHGVETRAVPLDLSRPEAAGELHAAVEALGLLPSLEILVLNAGMFFFGEVADADPARVNAMLQLHVVTPSLLCARFAGGLRARRRGRILVVSSISAWKDFPGIACYGSSKKYLRGFARALRSELRPYGVTVTCLAPGATATGLYDGTSVPVERARRLGVMMDPGPVAEAGLAALFDGRAECVPGLLTRVMTALAVLTPRFAIDLLRRHGPWLPLK